MTRTREGKSGSDEAGLRVEDFSAHDGSGNGSVRLVLLDFCYKRGSQAEAHCGHSSSKHELAQQVLGMVSWKPNHFHSRSLLNPELRRHPPYQLSSLGRSTHPLIRTEEVKHACHFQDRHRCLDFRLQFLQLFSVTFSVGFVIRLDIYQTCSNCAGGDFSPIG
jgi:hypothetical protein